MLPGSIQAFIVGFGLLLLGVAVIVDGALDPGAGQLWRVPVGLGCIVGGWLIISNTLHEGD